LTLSAPVTTIGAIVDEASAGVLAVRRAGLLYAVHAAPGCGRIFLRSEWSWWGFSQEGWSARV